MSFEFVDQLPPSKGNAGRRLDPLLFEFAQALRANPGQWAKWPRAISERRSRQIHWEIKRGMRRALPPGEFEACSRAGVAYARYIGGSDAASNSCAKPNTAQVAESAKASAESDPPKRHPARKADAPKLMTAEQSVRIGELMAALGVIDEADQRDLASRILGKPVPVPGKLTIDEADTLIAELVDALAAEQAKAEGGVAGEVL
ncbi:hypothetical protein [Nocardia sp. NPDC059239]|uniref:hypothetical protein n=1 Tax=unclassified Nocardia TaxID=2637762 RepID=UPI0036C58772